VGGGRICVCDLLLRMCAANAVGPINFAVQGAQKNRSCAGMPCAVDSPLTLYSPPLKSASCSSCSLISHSDASLVASTTATGGAAVRCREKIQDRLAAPLVGEQLRDLCAIIPSGRFLASSKTIAQRGSCAGSFTAGSSSKRCSRVWILCWHH